MVGCRKKCRVYGVVAWLDGGRKAEWRLLKRGYMGEERQDGDDVDEWRHRFLKYICGD